MPRSGDDRLRELLAALAAEDAAELVAEARAAGRDEARAVLQRLWRDAYLEAAAPPARREAPPPAHGGADAPPPARHQAPPGIGWWVYCVVAAGSDVPELHGVDPAGPVDVVTRGELAAVVSPVPLPDYDDEQLREHLEDLAWVERVARAHEHVLEATMATTTIVPLRLCTIYLTRERVEAFLDEQARELAAALAGLRARTEWGVKVFAPTAKPAERAEATGGSEYLARRRDERAAREEALRRAARCAQDVHERLEREAVRACVNPPQRPEAHGRDAEMLLNGAYLVEDERRAALRDTVDELIDEYSEFSIELTGPWPPYNFVAPSASAIR